jgi:hypothetical protein
VLPHTQLRLFLNETVREVLWMRQCRWIVPSHLSSLVVADEVTQELLGEPFVRPSSPALPKGEGRKQNHESLINHHSHSSLITHHSLLITHYSSLITHHSLLITPILHQDTFAHHPDKFVIVLPRSLTNLVGPLADLHSLLAGSVFATKPLSRNAPLPPTSRGKAISIQCPDSDKKILLTKLPLQ